MKNLKIILFLIISVSCQLADAQLRIESREDALRRQIEIAKLKRQLEDIRSGRNSSNYEQQNNNPRVTITTEVHVCSKNGYHDTGYEHHCFDLYLCKDGSVYWDRRRYEKRKYNDSLSGNYYMQKSGNNRYDLHITWENGSTTKGYVSYKGTRPEIHFDNYVFDAK